MAEPTPEQIDEMGAYFASLGVPVTGAHYDRDRLLESNREARHRNARSAPDGHQAMEKLAAGMLTQMREDVPITDWGQAVDVLLAAAGYLSSFAASGITPMSVVTTIAYLADDIATEEAAS